MDKNAYDILLFNYYREAELRGADLILRLINRMDDPGLQEKLSRHLADETRHAWLWTERIRALGGLPVRIDNGYHRHLRRKVGLPAKLLDLLALTYVVEERSRKRYEEHAARPDVDAATRQVLDELQDDERRHLGWVSEKLARMAAEEGQDDEGQDKVTAVLERYRALEEEVFRAMVVEERRALQNLTGRTDAD